MYAIDFEYDGQYLSDFGFIICDFDSTSGANVVSAGSKITFNKVSLNRGKKYSLTSTQYDECISTTFDICKNPDEYDYENMVISKDEYRALMRWLNRREFLKFHVLSEDEYYAGECYFNASFNIEKIEIGCKLYGMRLTMETNSPFGYGDEITTILTFSNTSVHGYVNYVSDEIGAIFPDVTITCNADGDLTIYNELEDCTTVIKNCTAGEIITLNGVAQIISSNYDSHDICNDFNYEFLRIGNTINSINNSISVSIPCTIEVKYAPIIKDTP